MLEAQAESDSNTFAELELWIAEHQTENLRVEALAERVNMSPRNFSRAYSKMRGRTPAKAVEAIRVDAARRRLEGTTERISPVAEACGFSNEEQMRSTFIRVLGVPPREYRKHFTVTTPKTAPQAVSPAASLKIEGARRTVGSSRISISTASSRLLFTLAWLTTPAKEAPVPHDHVIARRVRVIEEAASSRLASDSSLSTTDLSPDFEVD